MSKGALEQGAELGGELRAEDHEGGPDGDDDEAGEDHVFDGDDAVFAPGGPGLQVGPEGQERRQGVAPVRVGLVLGDGRSPLVRSGPDERPTSTVPSLSARMPRQY